MPDIGLATLSMDPIPKDWYKGNKAYMQDEYLALIADDPSASIDWRERRRNISSDVFLASSPKHTSPTNLSPTFGPFILDSGATMHISPDATDFYDLKPMPPRPIKGISRFLINATSIGKIHLRLSKGNTIILDPALYVPEAAVRLMSVLVLGSGLQKLISHFEGDGCWLTNRSGAMIVSGKVSSIGKRLYSINTGTPLAEHAYIAARVPSLETWHRRLGHVN